jgi:hypothetical protein
LSVLMRAAGELKERHDFERNATCAAAIVIITVTVCGIGTNLTARSGLARTGWQTGVCVGDFDNGGWDDLMLTYWSEQLYRTPPFVSAWMVEVGRLTCVPIFTSSSAATNPFPQPSGISLYRTVWQEEVRGQHRKPDSEGRREFVVGLGPSISTSKTVESLSDASGSESQASQR